jgi:hypothetical protein
VVAVAAVASARIPVERVDLVAVATAAHPQRLHLMQLQTRAAVVVAAVAPWSQEMEEKVLLYWQFQLPYTQEPLPAAQL